jgi:hypothetical protein
MGGGGWWLFHIAVSNYEGIKSIALIPDASFETFHGGDVSSRDLVMCCDRIPTFHRSILPPPSP